jgi:hypothetical protein
MLNPHHALSGLICLALLTLVGCQPAGPPPATPPGATFTGPRYLYNTVGSLSRLTNNEPLAVSGYGLVVDLQGTGSNEVPQFIRQWLINEMTKNGVGLSKYRDILDASPEQVLASNNTAVVRVFGIIPAGAVAGTRFDLAVVAADSRTTDLTGGRLWQTSLTVGGLNPERFFTEPEAVGGGAIYVDPVDAEEVDKFELERQRREALVVNGGRVEKTRVLELVLNQPSRQRARLIQDRINERFPAEPNAKQRTANAVSPLVIQLAIPQRFRAQPRQFLDLVEHLYIDRSRNFEPQQAQALANKLLEDPGERTSVVLAWKAFGPLAVPVLRRYYQHDEVDIRLAALEAGAFLQDERSSEQLFKLTNHPEPSVRRRVADALISLPNSIRGDRALRRLLDDENRSVRIAAYEALSSTGSELIKRTVINGPSVGGQPEIKLVIDRLEVEQPLIYVSQKQVPRLVIFNDDLTFNAPMLANVWGGQLMIRQDKSDEPAEVFYQEPVIEDGERRTKAHQHRFFPSVATLAYVLAHRWSYEEPQAGFDLTYGQVVDALYQLSKKGVIDADVEINRSILASVMRDAEQARSNQASGPERPETARPETLPNSPTVPSGKKP